MTARGGDHPPDHEAATGPLVKLTPDCSPKHLEEPCVYNRSTDELYIINSEALTFLEKCGRGAMAPDSDEDRAFVDFCLEEGVLETADELAPRALHLRQSPVPSLRYLLLHITDRCNLKCRHCFLGEGGSRELSLPEVVAIADQFETMQGLRLLISGGEPLLHRSFWEVNDYLRRKDLRVVLLTNGTLIDEETARRLSAQEVQISLDGMREAHDHLRGWGSFERSVAAIRHLTAAGVEVSVATMIHRRNLDNFDMLEELVRDLGAREWSIDLPSAVGRLADNTELLVDPRSAGPFLRRSYGGAIHEPLAGFACGAHLMAVMADGNVARCGFYADEAIGSIEEGPEACWQKIAKTPLSELECNCQFVEECRGGCRFRAHGYNKLNGADLCQCYRYGVLK
ncbi:MAG: radical SAM protein [Thermoleophilia bacterium]